MGELSSVLKPEQLAGRTRQDFHFILLAVRARVVDDSTRRRGQHLRRAEESVKPQSRSRRANRELTRDMRPGRICPDADHHTTGGGGSYVSIAIHRALR